MRRPDAIPGTATRALVVQRLGATDGIELDSDRELDLALRGEGLTVPRTEAQRWLGRVEAARRRSQYARGLEVTSQAITWLYRWDPSGVGVRQQLETSYGHLLAFADALGDDALARYAARSLLSVLKVKQPSEVSAAIWARYKNTSVHKPVSIPNASSKVGGPAASKAQPPNVGGAATVTVQTPRGGMPVWVDGHAVGVSPVVVRVMPGYHVISAGRQVTAAKWVRVAKGPSTVVLSGIESAGRWRSVAQTVAAWRSRERSANAISLSNLLAQLGVRAAFVITDEQVELWRLLETGQPARRTMTKRLRAVLDDASVRGAFAQAMASLPGATVGTARQPATTPGLGTGRAAKTKRDKWWVYAAIIGAVAVGTAIVVASEPERTQRVIISWP